MGAQVIASNNRNTARAAATQGRGGNEFNNAPQYDKRGNHQL